MTVADVVVLVRRRIAMGTMPSTLTALLERRGTIESAAVDLAAFTGHPYTQCLHALEVVYGCGC